MYDVVLFSSVFEEVKIAEPLGISYLAASLRKHGFRVKIIEPTLEGWSIERTVEEVLSIPSKIVGISILRDRHKIHVYQFLKLLKEKAPDRFVVMGGHGPSVGINSEDFYSTEYTTVRYEELGKLGDAFMLGESDHSFPMLVEKVLQGEEWRSVPGVCYIGENGKFVSIPGLAKVEDLDELPMMSRDVLEIYIDKYGLPQPASLSFGRGCMYSCTFCSVVEFEGLQTGKKHRQRSVESLIEEIRYLHDHYGINEFNFEDDNFIIRNKTGLEKLYSLCDAIEALDFKITFTFFCRADAVEYNLFKRFKEVGLNGIYFGIESVYEGDLEFFHKGVKLDRIYHALDTLHELGFSPAVGAEHRLLLGYIAWHPLSNFEQLKASSAFVKRYKLTPKLLRRSLRLYTGVPILNQIRELGLLNQESKTGWNYKDPRFFKLQQLVDKYFATVNNTRDRVRTVQKAAIRFHHADVPIERFETIWRDMDQSCMNYFDELIKVAEQYTLETGFHEAVEQFDQERRERLANFIKEHEVNELVAAAIDVMGLPKDTGDLFRK